MKQSLQQILLSAFNTAKRFPLVLAVALLGSTTLSLLMGDEVTTEQQNMMAVWGQTFALGIPLLLAATLFAESVTGVMRKLGVYKLAIALLIITYFHLNYVNTHGFSQGELSITFAGYFLAFHLLVSFLPVIKISDAAVFWHFNKTLFLRAAITVLYVGVLYAGLAGAMLALDQLLGFEIKSVYYGRLWVYMSGLGSVWMFLAHIPKKLEETVDTGYPKGLQVFAQYILMPLVLIYLIILYIYGLKIALSGTLPVGWVSNLILAFAVVGMLALLLLHPLTKVDGNKWVNRFTRVFYLALIPLLVLLYIAALTRINSYGFTELRYALLALAIWLTGVTLFMLVTRNKNIRAIPLSLFFTVLWVFFLPGFNLHSVSKNSQTERLQALLKDNKMWTDKKELMAPQVALPDSISAEMYNIAEYLSTQHGTTGMEPAIQIPDSFFDKNSENRSRYDLTQWLSSALASYGISDGLVYTEDITEAVMEDTASPQMPAAVPNPVTFPDLEIRFRGPTPAVVSVPKGNWTHCVDVEIRDFRYVSNSDFNKVVQINRDVTEKNLYISNNKYTEVFNLDSLMGSLVHAYKFPKQNGPNNFYFPNFKEVVTLRSKNAVLQVFYMEYNWNTKLTKYELAEFNGKLWLR